MSLLQIGILLLVFVAVVASVAYAFLFFMPSAAQERLRNLLPQGPRRQPAGGSWVERAARITAPFGRFSAPVEGLEQSGIRGRFMNAGIRNPSAPMLFFGVKTLLAIALPVLTYLYLAVAGNPNLSLNSHLFFLLLAAALGYYLPNAILSRLVLARQREVFENFPDALDLMTVCVESGLGIEAALSRVADDIHHKSEVLSEELRLVGLELRAGSDRARALRNLATRTGVEEVSTWVAMLVQADRFGTSIADALRIHSDMLRTKRRQRAEEEASKIALKLLFPLIFCIFPSLMLVLIGPTFIQIYRVLIPMMGATTR
ncbi:MAG: type II secretion system F family protein [Rhodocyclaceae bacterium]